MALAAVFAVGSGVLRVAAAPDTLSQEAQRPAQASDQLIVRGTIVQIHAPRVFTVRESTPAGRELLVLSPRPLSDAVTGGRVAVAGLLRRLDAAELSRSPAWATVDDLTRMRFAGRPVLVANSVLAATSPEGASGHTAEETPTAEPGQPISPPDDTPARDGRSLLTVRASTLVSDIEGLAGQQVRVLSARVVGVLEPGAFLIEPATRYLKPMGDRDRVLVLIRDGTLRVSEALVVGSVVQVVGQLRTLLGVRATGDIPWPAGLAPETVERLEVRAALLATSVQTAEGIELTDRAPGSAAYFGANTRKY